MRRHSGLRTLRLTLLDLAMGPYSGKETGEMALLRQLLEQVPEGHILLTDKLYCSYFLVALLLNAKCDLVVRLHGARKIDFTKSKRLGAGDNPKEYPAEEIAALYRKRWLVELDIRAIKVQLGMDVLRCKTPAMVRK